METVVLQGLNLAIVYGLVNRSCPRLALVYGMLCRPEPVEDASNSTTATTRETLKDL